MVATLRKTGHYSEEELQLLQDAIVVQTLKQGEFLLEVGAICSHVCFLENGAVYQYRLDEENTEHIIDLNAPNDWIVNHQSFTSRKPSSYCIQAYEDSIIQVLSIDTIHALIARSQNFLQMGSIMEKVISRVRFFDGNYTPDEKYQYILEHQPALIQKFPQKMLASYLKMSPETLSRVRKRIS